jgi:hypothetical protein
MGKKTALAILAATRMPAITTVKVSNLRIAFFGYVKVPGGRLIFVAVPGPVRNSAANTFRPKFLDRGLAFPSIAFLAAWSLRSGVSSTDDCLNVGAGATLDS